MGICLFKHADLQVELWLCERFALFLWEDFWECLNKYRRLEHAPEMDTFFILLSLPN